MGKTISLINEQTGFSIAQECRIFVYSIVMGIVFCLLLCLLMAFRQSFRHNRATIGIVDFLAVVLVSFIYFLFCLKNTGGILRWFVFAGAFLGFLLLRLTFFPYIVAIFNLILKPIHLLLIMIIRILEKSKGLLQKVKCLLTNL